MAIEIEKASLPSKAPSAGASGKAPSRWQSARDLLEGLTQESTKIGARERMFFTERLALLLDTGIPLHVGLESLARQVSHGGMSTLTRQLNDDVAGGQTFARALSEHPEVFPATYVNLVSAAEAGGFLPIALDRLRDMEERREELRSTLTSAISYSCDPGVLLGGRGDLRVGRGLSQIRRDLRHDPRPIADHDALADGAE